MTVFSDWRVLLICFTVKTLVELLFGTDDQILRKMFLVTKDFPHWLHSRNLSPEGVLRG